MVTALLGKATDEQVNPLALQAGADLVGHLMLFVVR
jgi:SacI restriction endonuclease